MPIFSGSIPTTYYFARPQRQHLWLGYLRSISAFHLKFFALGGGGGGGGGAGFFSI